jgi:hypothetical protein
MTTFPSALKIEMTSLHLASNTHVEVTSMTGDRFPLNCSADEAFRRKMTITSEVLKNLTYLTMSDAGDTVSVCRYMGLA